MGLFSNLKETYWAEYKKNNPPIRNLETIDIAAKTNEGGAHLFIITDRHSIDSSHRTRELIKTKIENYLKYIGTTEFKEKFPNANRENTEIVLTFSKKIDQELIDFIEGIKPSVIQGNARLSIQIKG